ncbi:MAG: phosphoribosyl transferase [Oscillibacter sp.]|nr:phosphoribosyl transferase [Oscillibacter sp.]
MKTYTSDSCLRLARRVNNRKRTYLLVNPLQGKHLPVSPIQALEMMKTLGDRLAEEFPETRLVIGFAETATAVAAMAASCFDKRCVYIHTTRESLPEGSAIEFREEHSHAVEQSLYCREMDAWLRETETVVLIDDEISTGRTILNMIDQLSAQFPSLRSKRIVAASLLNRVSQENQNRLAAEGILCRYLVKLPQEDYTQAVAGFSVREAAVPPPVPVLAWERLPLAFCDPGRGVLAFDYLDVCRRRAEALLPCLREALGPDRRLLVLGAEECMLPALVLGAVLERQGGYAQVRCHATTRSPIGVSGAPGYPIREGWRLPSLCDANRTAYLYNLDHYDAVLLVSSRGEPAGLEALAKALSVHGCGARYWIGGSV